MNGANPEPIGVWERNIAEDDERRFEILETLLPNQKIFGLWVWQRGFSEESKCKRTR